MTRSASSLYVEIRNMRKIVIALVLLSSAATAAEVTQEKTDQWIALQADISKLSREQNGGKVDSQTICHMISKSVMACHFGIFARFDGQNRMLIQSDEYRVSATQPKEHLEMAGRAVCDRDHKICKDFDRGKSWPMPNFGK